MKLAISVVVLALLLGFSTLSAQTLNLAGLEVRLGMPEGEVRKLGPVVKQLMPKGLQIMERVATEGKVLMIFNGNRDFVGDVTIDADGKVIRLSKKWYEADETDSAYALAGEIFGLLTFLAPTEAENVVMTTRTSRAGDGIVTENIEVSNGKIRCTISRLTDNKKGGQRTVSLFYSIVDRP